MHGIVLASAAAAESPMAALIPKAPEVFFSLVSFVILWLVLGKFAFPPITRMLEKRSETIRESLEKAEETRVEAERLLVEYKEQMTEARKEAAAIIEQGRTVAENMKAEIVAKAREDAEAARAKALDAIRAEKEAAMAELRAEVADISVAVAGKVIGSTLKAKDHEALIERYIAEVGNLNEN